MPVEKFVHVEGVNVIPVHCLAVKAGYSKYFKKGEKRDEILNRNKSVATRLKRPVAGVRERRIWL